MSTLNGATDIGDLLLNATADDDGNAHCAHGLFGEQFLFCPAYGWMTWCGTHWQREGAESALERALFAMLKRRRLLAVDSGREAVVKVTAGSTRRMSDCKKAFRSFVEIDINEFDSDPDTLNVQNGVLDLRSGQLTAHDSRQRFSYCLRVPYDPDADDSQWQAILRENISEDAEDLAYLQKCVGYSFTGYTNEECLWYLYGPARSGKGTFTETLLSLLKYPLGVEVDFATFTSDRSGDTQNFDLAPLKPARFIVASESRRYEGLNEAKIKQATGGDYIRCAFKHGAHFTYRPQFKIWLVSNHPVRADVDDDATWYRIKTVEFPNGHTGAEDKSLKGHLITPDALAGVLKWVVEGAKAWYAAKDGLRHTWRAEQATQRQRDELDHVQQWLSECVTLAPENFVSNATLYQSYETWCEDNGQSAYKAVRFGQTMSAKGFTRDSQRIGDKIHRGFRGLILKG